MPSNPLVVLDSNLVPDHPDDIEAGGEGRREAGLVVGAHDALVRSAFGEAAILRVGGRQNSASRGQSSRYPPLGHVYLLLLHRRMHCTTVIIADLVELIDGGQSSIREREDTRLKSESAVTEGIPYRSRGQSGS